jgi:hypothetical protein
MSLALLNAVAGVGTLVLLAATAAAGLVQLRHMRASNELAALLEIERDFRSAELHTALRDVQRDLARKLEDPAYRARLGAPGYLDPRQHPEMTVCNWFDRAGALVRAGYVSERLFLTSFGRLVTYYWQVLEPAVAVLRRTRGSGQYANFEYLAYLIQARARTRGVAGTGSAPRTAVADPWLEADRRGAQ